MKDKVSIIIPAYNAANYIEQTLDAVVKQTYKNIEVIVVNDGSIDNTSAVANSFMAGKGVDFCVVDKSNGGQASARNCGLRKCTGNYVTFLDSDDYINSNYINRLLSELQKVGADFAACPFQNVYESDFESLPKYDKGNKPYDTDTLSKMYLHREIILIAPAMLIRRDVISGIEFDEKCPYDEDGLFVWDLLFRTKSGAYCNSPMYNYRIREGSVMHSLTVDKCHQSIICYKEHCKEFANVHPGGVSHLIFPNYKLASQHVLAKNVNYKGFKIEYDRTDKSDIKQLVKANDMKLCMLSMLYLVSPYLFYKVCRFI